MRNLKLFILTLASIFLLMACKEEQSSGNASLIDKCSVIATREVTKAGDTVVVCDLAKVKEKVILPLSQLVDSLELIRLESIDAGMIGDDPNIELTEHYIGVKLWDAYKLFTRQGKFVADIGRKGQGPGEYTEVQYSQIDEANNRIYLTTFLGNRILVYDLKGNHIGEDIPLVYPAHRPAINVRTDRQQVIIMQARYEGAKEIPAVWVQDFKGNLLQSNYMEQLNEGWADFENKIYSIRFEDMVQSGRMAPGTDITDFSVFASHPRVDSLYHYDASMNRATPKFTVAFRENYLHMYHETPRHYLAQLRVIGTPYPDNFAGCLLVDKSTLKGAQIEIMADELGGITLPLKQRLQIDYRYFAFCLEPGILLMLLEERLKEKDKMSKGDLAKITELLNSISEDDNNYLLFGEWK